MNVNLKKKTFSGLAKKFQVLIDDCKIIEEQNKLEQEKIDLQVQALADKKAAYQKERESTSLFTSNLQKMLSEKL